jgi:ketosteroid isomerase-like protein
MSQENVEVVQRVFEAVNRGDIDAALELVADDYVMDWSNSIGPGKGVYHGEQGVREIWASIP